MNSVLLLLYRHTLKEAKKIPNEKVKQFAMRRIREEYRSSENPKNNSILEAQKSINMLKRYNLISKLKNEYSSY